MRLISLKFKWFLISFAGLLLIAMATAWLRYPQQELLSKRFYLISEQHKGAHDLAELRAHASVAASDFEDALSKWRSGHRNLRLVIDSGEDEVSAELLEAFDNGFLALDTHFSEPNAMQSADALVATYEAAGDRLALHTSGALNAQLEAYGYEVLAILGSVLLLALLFLWAFKQGSGEETPDEQAGEPVLAPVDNDLARAAVRDLSDYLLLEERTAQLYYHHAISQMVELASSAGRLPAPFLLIELLKDVQVFVASRHVEVEMDIDAIAMQNVEVHADAELIGRVCALLTDRVLALTGAQKLRFVLNRVDATAEALHVRFDWHLGKVQFMPSNLAAWLSQPGQGLAVAQTLVQAHNGRVWLEQVQGGLLLKANMLFTDFAERSVRIGLDQLHGKRLFLADADAVRLRERVKELSEYGLMVTPFNSLMGFIENPSLFAKFDFGVCLFPEEETERYSFLAALHSRPANERLPLIGLHPADRQPKEKDVWAATLPEGCTTHALADALIYILSDGTGKRDNIGAPSGTTTSVPAHLNLN